MFSAVVTLLLRLLGPCVDDANRAIATELGSLDFVDLESGEIQECERVAVEDQPYDCAERMRWALLTISNRESPGNWSARRRYTGIHAGDSRHAGRVYTWAQRFDRLSWWCPSHWGERGMSTVGPHGLMYGYNVQRLGVPGNCVPTWAFGISTVSARAAADRYLSRCTEDPEPGGWCPTTKQIVRTFRRAQRRRYEF